MIRYPGDPAASEDRETQDSRLIETDENPGAGRGTLRNRAAAAAIAASVIVLAGSGLRLFLSGDDLPPPRKVQEITIVKILPPPPPPPPPPPKPPEQKMVEQTPVKQEIQDPKPVEQPKDSPKPKDLPKDEPPPGPLALDSKADGPGDSFNLGGKPGGRGILGGGGGGGGSSRFGWYASIVQQEVAAALRANPKTRSAVMQFQIRLWADASGRISRVQLVSPTGNPEIDNAIRNEVLSGVTLREPPPKDMPMPIVARISARRPT